MRLVLMSLCLFPLIASLLAGCADPTEGISEARVNEPQAVAPDTASGEDEPQPMPMASAQAPASEPVQTLVFTGDSVIGFEGYKVSGSHIGGFGKFDGTVVLPSDGVHAASIDITIDMASTYSDDPGLTTKLKSADFFDVEQFPEARFQSTGIEQTDQGYTVSGDLTLHGVTRNISFPAQITVNGDTLIAEAEFTINRLDFGIVYPGMADDLIKERVVIRLDVEAEPAS